jgi:DNA-binding transcriptional ArsR family regulator
VLVKRPIGVESFGPADNLPAGELRTVAHTTHIGIVVPLLKRPGDRRAPSECKLVSQFVQFVSRILIPSPGVREWSFFTNHARVLICIARDPGIRLRDLALAIDVTERSAYGIVSDLSAAGYVVKEKDGRRNRYRVETQLPLPESIGRERTIGDVLGLLVDVDARRRPRQSSKERHAR